MAQDRRPTSNLRRSIDKAVRAGIFGFDEIERMAGELNFIDELQREKFGNSFIEDNLVKDCGCGGKKK